MKLLQEYSTEHKSIKWLEKIRWDKEPVCPHCSGIENVGKYKSKKHTYWHRDCRKAFTVKTNTIMHASKMGSGYLLYANRKKRNIKSTIKQKIRHCAKIILVYAIKD